jgi:hypothetical protein
MKYKTPAINKDLVKLVNGKVFEIRKSDNQVVNTLPEQTDILEIGKDDLSDLPPIYTPDYNTDYEVLDVINDYDPDEYQTDYWDEYDDYDFVDDYED